MLLLFKACIGAFIVILIDYISKTNNYFISGLIPLFPTFALIAHFIIFNTYDHQSSEMTNTIIFGMFSLIPYFIYLISLFLIFKYTSISFYMTLLIGIILWSITAYILFELKRNGLIGIS